MPLDWSCIEEKKLVNHQDCFAIDIILQTEKNKTDITWNGRNLDGGPWGKNGEIEKKTKDKCGEYWLRPYVLTGTK